MKIYTKTGDDGETGLFGGGRVRKDDPRIEAYGTVDELNAALGMARAEKLPADIDAVLAALQHDLFRVGSELSTRDPARHHIPTLTPAHIERLEQAIDRFEATLEPLKQFILPGGTRAAAGLHVARTICRRAERRLVSAMNAAEDHPISATLLIYLNRVGDLLFVLARSANAAAGEADVRWQGGDKPS
jgi:cob(I)alamin adenosyltransferase